MSKFDDYLDAVLADAKVLLNNTISEGKEEARAILETHVENSKTRLRRWTKLLADGDITQREFRLLVNNQVTLGRMRLRTIEVIGKQAAITFRNNLRSLFIDKAFEVFL
jgi:hypothetical protein